jgi:hypothetical protein
MLCMPWNLRATLDEGPWSRDEWIQAILLVESFKLVPKAFKRESKTKKWQIEAKPTWHLFSRENQLVQTERQCWRESSWFGEPIIKLRTNIQSNTRIQFASNQSKLVLRKLDLRHSSKVGLSHKTQNSNLFLLINLAITCTIPSKVNYNEN